MSLSVRSPLALRPVGPTTDKSALPPGILELGIAGVTQSGRRSAIEIGGTAGGKMQATFGEARIDEEKREIVIDVGSAKRLGDRKGREDFSNVFALDLPRSDARWTVVVVNAKSKEELTSTSFSVLALS